jgi:hypothetical protein
VLEKIAEPNQMLAKIAGKVRPSPQRHIAAPWRSALLRRFIT